MELKTPWHQSPDHPIQETGSSSGDLGIETGQVAMAAVMATTPRAPLSQACMRLIFKSTRPLVLAVSLSHLAILSLCFVFFLLMPATELYVSFDAQKKW